MVGDKHKMERRRLLHARRAEKRPCLRTTKSTKREDVDAVLNRLKSTILDKTALSSDELSVLRSGDNFTKIPKLALAYFHCCGCHPDAFVYNNEHVREGDAVDRLKNVVDRSVVAEDVSRCQVDVKSMLARNKTVWACCSCCEIIFGDANVEHTTVSKLPDTFRVTSEEKRVRFGMISAEIRQAHFQVIVKGDIWYHLNPDLVLASTGQSEDGTDEDARVVLCKRCSGNPRKNKYSIASGHDYGRRGNLSDLNDVATNCISPIRLFGIEIALSGRFAHGHSICFPADGPIKCSSELPQVDEDCHPHVTFVGPHDQWRVISKSFRHLYDIPVDDVYAWLEVLSATHSYWREEGIMINRSQRRRKQLEQLTTLVESRVIASETDTVKDIADTEFQEMYAGTEVDIGNHIITRKSAVLQEGVSVCGSSSNQSVSNAIVDSFLETIRSPVKVTRESDDAVIGESGDLEHVIPIERSSSPVTEWTSNGDILAGAFPTLFMTGGAMLPQGSLPQDFVDHLMVYYDGRFEQSVTLIATMFNQLQRHSAIQKTARIGSLHGEALLKLTDLANNPLFRQQLEVAHAHPDSKLAKILNTKLLRILSIAGDTVPFSPFELASAKPKIDAMRTRYDMASHWLTIAPPEHDDLALHRVALLRSSKRWNDPTSPWTKVDFSWTKLPDALQKSARARLQISNRYPALAVRAFEEAFDVVTTGLIRCRASKDVRKSHDYGERERGVLSAVVGFAAVVEPQKCGRLHTHMTVYSSTWTPQLLVRSVCHPELQDLAKQWIDSVSRTYLSDNIWDRFNQLKSPDGKVESHLQRSSEMVLPDAASDYNKFDTIAQLCLLGTNLHHHSSTCIKGRRGKFMCRLNRPAGVFNYETAPVELTLLKNGALWKGERGIVEASSVSENTKSIIDVGYCTEEDGHLLRQSTERPVVWEQRRPSRDSMVVETNLPLSLLSRSHTNASIISCEDAGDSVQEYQRNYMTKDSGGLQNTASIFMAAVDEVRKYPSSADDRESPLRQAKYLACRTVNAFAGAHEWPLSVMIYALRGHHSFISSDVYWYIFPWSFVRHLENIDERVDGSCFQYGNRVECDEDIDEDSVMDPQIEQQLDDIICSVENEVRQVRRAMEDVDRENMFSSNDDTCHDSGTISGARSFTLKGKTVFVSQVQSYVHRGKHFSDFSPAEFESIVDVRLVKSGNEKLSKKSRGRKRRDGFAFAPTHPLYPHYEGCIRVKFKTPMLGGAPPPNYKVALRKPHLMDQLAKYLLSSFVPWELATGKPPFELNFGGLQELSRQWDHSDAPLVARQRYRLISNILRRGNQNSASSDTYSIWRARNVDWWADRNLQQIITDENTEVYNNDSDGDEEKLGRFADTDALFQLVRMSALNSKDTRSGVGELRKRFWSLVPVEYSHQGLGNSKLGKIDGVQSVLSVNIYTHQNLHSHGEARSLGDISHSIQRMMAGTKEQLVEGSGKAIDAKCGGDSSLGPLTNDQRRIVNYLIQNVGHREACQRNQTLSTLHGAAGTGKSVVIRAVVKELEARGVDVVVTCPTGIGASHLPHGRTFHSAFKVGRKRCKRLPLNKVEQLRLLFHEHVGMVIIDEVSMLDMELFVLMDNRLRALYDPTKLFGGISILLVGDFLQLAAVHGISLCKMMYTNDDKQDCIRARELFRRFRVFQLKTQLRAGGCVHHKKVLDDCHSLPSVVPHGNRWGRDHNDYHPISYEVLEAVTTPLTKQDLRTDPNWLGDTMRILVTTNIDRAALTPCAALMLANHEDKLLFKWARRLHTEVPDGIKTMLYDEDVHPYMYGYFVQGAPAQILDNSNGNLAWGVANGTPCRFHSMAWEDDDVAAEVEKRIRRALHNKERIVELSVPPDYINVVLVDSNYDSLSGEHWPEDLNLDTRWIMDEHDSPLHKQSVVIPIGLVKSNAKTYKVRLGNSSDQNQLDLYYEQHAVEISLVMTVWKAQGATMSRVLLLLESATTKFSWEFEHLYVALSRVRAASKLRCFPVSPGFRRSTLRRLKPSIYTVKWLMSINDKGLWCPLDEAT